jgi:hypothetical protein
VIDYSVPDLSAFIGTFDISKYLDSMTLRLPHHEPGQILTWSGDFEVSMNTAAVADGLEPADFDERGTPGRWRPGQQPIKLKIRGKDFPTLRIEHYRYNPDTKRGKGRLVQILDILNADRPELPQGLVTQPPKKIPAGGLAIVTLALLGLAVEAATIPIAVGAIAPIGGSIRTDTTSRNPVADAQKLAGLSWTWLGVDTAEQIYSLNGAPEAAPMAFIRTELQVEAQPNLEALQFASPTVIVTGSTYIDDVLPCAEPPEPAPGADNKGRPTKQKTSSLKPFSEVFPGGVASGYVDDPTLAEEKTILYAYEDRRFLDDILPSELQSDYNAVIGLTFGLQANEPLFTATIKSQPFGFLFPDAGTNASLTIGEAIVETPKVKATWKPRGVMSGLDQDTQLILASREELTTKYLPSVPQSTPEVNPKTGNHTCFEPLPKKEDPQIAPERPLKEVPIVGTARVQYAGWTPVVVNPLIVSFGFLPDVGIASNLARQIARREERRRDSWLVKMPIPDEWATIGFRPLVLCKIGTKLLQIDAPVISITNGDAHLEFEGGLVSTDAIEVIDVGTGFAVEASVSVGEASDLALGAAVICNASITVGTYDPGGGGDGGGGNN